MADKHVCGFCHFTEWRGWGLGLNHLYEGTFPGMCIWKKRYTFLSNVLIMPRDSQHQALYNPCLVTLHTFIDFLLTASKQFFRSCFSWEMTAFFLLACLVTLVFYVSLFKTLVSVHLWVSQLWGKSVMNIFMFLGADWNVCYFLPCTFSFVQAFAHVCNARMIHLSNQQLWGTSLQNTSPCTMCTWSKLASRHSLRIRTLHRYLW